MQDYTGVPYVWGGRSMQGVDCYGLVWLVLKQEFSKTIPSLQGMSDKYEYSVLVSANKPLVDVTQVDAPIDGDIVLFFIRGSAAHVGIFLDGGILHATNLRGTLYEKINSKYLSRFSKKEYYRV